MALHKEGDTVYKRKKLLINPEFQINFLWPFLGLCLITLALNFTTFSIFFYQLRNLGHEANLDINHPYFQFIIDQFNFMGLLLLINCFISLGLFTFFGLLLSNRIAGPLYRLVNFLKEVRRGDNDFELRFRKKDYFPEVADAVNKTLEKYRGKRPPPR